MNKNLNEANCPRRPITALRRCEAELTLLRSQIPTLAQLVADFAESVSEIRRNLDALSDRGNRALDPNSDTGNLHVWLDERDVGMGPTRN